MSIQSEIDRINNEVSTHVDLIDQIKTALKGKASGGSGAAEPVIEPLEVTENGAYTAPEGVDGYSPVTVNVPVPEGYVKPTGTMKVSENGSYDVTGYASVDVNVALGGDPSLPAGYARAGYIKFTGKQIVDTGIVCTQDTKIRILFTRDSDNAMYMYGVVNSGNTASVTAYMTSSGGSWRFGNKYSAKDIVANEELVQTAIVAKTGFIRADDTAAISGVNDFETIGSLTFGAVRNADGTVAAAQFIGKALLLQMWQGDEEVLRLAPLVSTDGVYRFYDEVSGNFHDSITDTPLDGGNL